MSGGNRQVNGWFITTRDLLSVVFGTLGLVVTIVGGIYLFFSTRDTSAAVVNDRVNSLGRRMDRFEEAVYGNDGLNVKFTDIRAKLEVLVNLAGGDKKKPDNK